MKPTRKLRGAAPPRWFADQSDGCSVPTGFLRWVLDAKAAKKACLNHDYAYYLTAILYAPESVEFRASRHHADVDLKYNVQIISKGWLRGRLFGRWYYKGVRFGGCHAIKTRFEKLVTPPDLKALAKVKYSCEVRNRGNLTTHAEDYIGAWNVMLTLR